MSTANISRRYGARGYTGTVVTACAASNQAMGEAAEVIRRGVADVIISGGAEAPISKLGLAGFCAMKALTEQNEFPASASRPFDKTRDGFVPAEGAGIVILESLEHALARNAPILAEIAGYGISSDAITSSNQMLTEQGLLLLWTLPSKVQGLLLQISMLSMPMLLPHL